GSGYYHSRSAPAQPHLVESRPQLTGEEQAIAGGIVGDPVGHVLGAAPLVGRHETGQINAADHAPRDGIDPHDPVGGPDIRIDLAADEFELVERLDRTAGVGDVEHAADCERHRIEEPQPRRAVAHASRGADVGEAPALAGVGELTGKAEPEIVDEALLRLPRELNDSALEDREALGEVLARHAPARQDAASLEVDPPHARPAVEPGA